MTPYLLLLGSITAVAIIASIKDSHMRWGVPIIFSILLAFMALRDPSVGADTYNYVSIFLHNGMTYGDAGALWQAKGGFTSLYDLYGLVIYRLFPSPQASLIFNSCIIIIGVFFFIRLYADESIAASLLYVFMYCYFFAFNGMRQSLACSIILLALIAYKKGFLVLAAILSIIAVGFHQTSVFLVAVIMVAFLVARLQGYGYFKVFVLALVASFIISRIYEPLFNLFVSLFSRYSMYEEGASPFSFSDANQGRQALLYLAVALFFGFAACNKAVARTFETIGSGRELWVVAAFSIGFGIFCTSYELLARLIYYLLPFLACAVSKAARAIDRENHTCMARLSVLVGFGLLCLYMLSENYSLVVPYAICI